MTAVEPLACGESHGTLETSGYVVHSLQTAFQDGIFADRAEEAIVRAVNCVGDMGGIGVIAGGVAGARFGASQLPVRWLAVIGVIDELEALATRFNTTALSDET